MINRSNRGYLWAAAAVSIVLFSVFKLFYPYPNMVMDSYVYLKGAVLHLGANSFPIGYSKFLQLFDLFSKSAVLLVSLQYVFLESACMLLFFTLLYFFRLSKVATYIIFIFLFCNPLFLFISNFIMSDALFTALSIYWITQLIWIIGSPRSYMIWTHALLLFFAFAVRYNALYYPVVASTFILLSRLQIWFKVAGVLLQLVFIGAFVMYTRDEMKRLTGLQQFSPFGGWQLANNALYMYGHNYLEYNEPAPIKFHDLDSTVRRYFQRTRRTESLLDYNAEGPGFYYMVSDNSPLKRYMIWRYGADTVFQNFKKWGPMGIICSAYGSYLIKKHPLDFMRYWIGPNTIRYLYPPTEIFSMNSPYFLRDDDLGQMARQTFDLKTLTVRWPLIQFRTNLLSFYPLFFTMLNLYFVAVFLGFCVFGSLKTNRIQSLILLAIAFLWVCNLGFSITASCVVLRYQLFIMIIQFAFAVLLTDYIWQSGSAAMVKTSA